MKIVIWQSVLTEHQAHTLRSLQSLVGEPIEFILGTRELLERKKQGWSSYSSENISAHELPENGWWNFASEILTRYPTATHLFCGLWADRRFFPIMLRAQSKGLKTALMMEPYIDSPISYFGERRGVKDYFKHVLRPAMYFLGGRLVATRTTSLFAISSKAVEQFRAVGFQKDRIFPFGYFVPPALPSDGVLNVRIPRGALRLVFVGSLIERKGLSVLLEAVGVAQAAGSDVWLDVFGPGDPSVFKCVPANVVFRGSIEFGQVQHRIANYDLMVLPSLHDGWGVVVNESLLAGVPVIVSDVVGARTLVDCSHAGAVFPSGKSEALGNMLVDLFRNPGRIDEWRLAARDFRQKLLPETAARYMYECLRYVDGATKGRPVSPWYQDEYGRSASVGS